MAKWLHHSIYSQCPCSYTFNLYVFQIWGALQLSIILEIIAHETIPQCPLDHRNKIDSCLECKIESETTKVSTKHLFLSKSSRVQLAKEDWTLEWTLLCAFSKLETRRNIKKW